MTETEVRRNRPYAPRMAPDERREQLLDAVLQVIVDQGVHKVSIESVSKQAGVTRPVVYGLFDDANHLLRASLDREERGALAQLADVLPAIQVDDPRAAIIATLEGFLRAVTDQPDRWRAAFTLVDSSTPAFRQRVERAQQVLIGAIERLCRAAVHDPDTDVEMLARALYTLLWGAGRLVLAELDQFPPERITTFADQFIRSQFGQSGRPTTRGLGKRGDGSRRP
jgi:AcrR family transcriptional regulator